MSHYESRTVTLHKRFKFNEWRNAATTQRVKHIWLARVWLLFGYYGAARVTHIVNVGPNVAQSIAVLYFISVYANYESHRAEAGTFRVEEKQEAAEENAHV